MVQEEKAKEAAKFQEKIDSLEDTEYKKTLEETKETVKKEKEEIKQQEQVKQTLDYIHSLNEKETSRNSEIANKREQEDSEKNMPDNLKSVSASDDQESAGNFNDNAYHEDSQTQLDEHQTALMVLKAIADSQKTIEKANSTIAATSTSQKKQKQKPVKPVVTKHNDTIVTSKDKNSTADTDPPRISKLGPVKTPVKYKADASTNKTGAAKPVPKVEKKEDRASNDDLKKKKKQQSKQSMVQQSQPAADTEADNDEDVETSSEVLADDFDSDSKSVHSLAQRSNLADNMQDDADKYDFADNYQQTEDDVNPSQLEDKHYVQEADKSEKEDAWDDDDDDE